MPFDWKSCVALARRLAGEAAGKDDAEALQRAAVSRAYFGVFCYARNYAISFLKFESEMTATTMDGCGITCGIENDKATPNAWNGFGNGETMLTTLMNCPGTICPRLWNPCFPKQS